MIFVTVGMHSAGFDRLIRAMDRIASKIDEPVVMQIGSTSYEPQHAEFFRFATYEEMQDLNRQSRLVVCQAATSILTALEQGTPVIAVPRQKRYGEHIDDHQVEFAQALAELIGINVILNVDELQPDLVSEVTIPRFQPGTYKKQLVGAIKSYIQEISK